MPRAGLTPGRVIAEAATVADEVGLDRLTLAAVAHRCGVSLPGLYKHVAGLDEVKRGISIAAVRELTQVAAAAAAGVSGRDALAAISSPYRSYALTYPGRYAASIIAPASGDAEHTEAAEQAFVVIAAAFKGYHLDGESLIHAIRMWRAACHGIATMESAGGFGLPESIDVSFGLLMSALDAAFEHMGERSQLG